MPEGLSAVLMGHAQGFVYALLLLELVLLHRAPKRSLWLLWMFPGLPLFAAIQISYTSLMEAFASGIPSQFTPLIGSTVNFLLTVPFWHVCLSIGKEELLLTCVFSYMVQNLSRRLSVVLRLLVPALPFDYFFWELLFAAAAAVLCYLFLIRSGLWQRLMEQFNETKVSVLLAGLVMLTLCVLLNTMFGVNDLDENLYCNIAICSFSVLTIFFLYTMLQNAYLERNNQVVHHLLQSEQKQYHLSQESISIVNMKCHDLKHQIASIRAVSGKDQQEALRELESAVMIYDTVAKTGNEMLDTVLTEKALYCEQHSIVLTYMIDQEKLSFFNGVDLYALFANALDNAIESVLQEACEKRVISISVSSRGALLSIRVENYCSRPPRFLNGRPVTTKADTNNHGFGTQSIQYIAAKYNGNAVFHMDGDFFVLDIMLPIAEG